MRRSAEDETSPNTKCTRAENDASGKPADDDYKLWYDLEKLDYNSEHNYDLVKDLEDGSSPHELLE